ncbi:hypothetical protein WR25_05802 isoform D [Diploscapter pachys]|nr:hypothetical protein WR25_05802 isoform B [Diploscapter pachys]PAV63637.1 hypothetical protein WR25_05802 isoform C [Diploscapter pachys]PAV63638.1 hypothetical protein WR25_05802 isoform D [Diploscapter pachys]
MSGILHIKPISDSIPFISDKCGGLDIDQLVFDDIMKQIIADNKGEKPTIGIKAERRLRIACEKVKSALSFAPHTRFDVDSIYMIPGTDDDKDFVTTMKREEIQKIYEKLIDDCIDKATDVCNGIKPKFIILAGGSTRIPLVMNGLKQKVELFKDSIVLNSLNVDEVAAMGAAAIGSGAVILDDNEQIEKKSIIEILEKRENRAESNDEIQAGPKENETQVEPNENEAQFESNDNRNETQIESNDNGIQVGPDGVQMSGQGGNPNNQQNIYGSPNNYVKIHRTLSFARDTTRDPARDTTRDPLPNNPHIKPITSEVNNNPYIRDAIAIDIGTSKCRISICKDKYIQIVEHESSRSVPSYVALSEQNEWLVGRMAENYAVCLQNPSTSIAITIPIQSEQGYENVVKGCVRSAVDQIVAEMPSSTATQNIELIDEPIAVAAAYAPRLNLHSEGNVALVFCMGAGYLQVMAYLIQQKAQEEVQQEARQEKVNWTEWIIAQISGIKPIVKNFAGDNIDRLIFDNMMEKLTQQNGGKIPKISPRAERRLKIACEKMKCALSFAPHTRIDVDSLYRNNENEDQDLVKVIQKDEIKGYYNEEVDKIIKKVGEVYKDLKPKFILLAGGSTRLPVITEYLTREFPRSTICNFLNVDEVAAIGAAAIVSKTATMAKKPIDYEEVIEIIKKQEEERRNPSPTPTLDTIPAGDNQSPKLLMENIVERYIDYQAMNGNGLKLERFQKDDIPLELHR